MREETARKTFMSEIKFLAIHKTKLQIYVQLIIAPLPIRAHEGNPLEINKLFNRWSAAPKINQFFLQTIQWKKHNYIPIVMGQERHNGFNLKGMH